MLTNSQKMQFSPEFAAATWAILLHVANYNLTAQIEHYTRIFTKILGKNAFYVYAIYLIGSALIRDHIIQNALITDSRSFSKVPMLESVPIGLGIVLFLIGIALNLWTLKALGIKGMYNGDSFGYLMTSPVNTGPFQYFSDPQYFGTTLSLLGSAIYYQSINGLILTGILYAVFWISVELVEKPHMNKLYSKQKKAE